MYKELASLIYDNYFLTNYEIKTEKYIITARADCEYIDDIIEERSKLTSNNQDSQNKNENPNVDMLMDNMSKMYSEIAEIKQLLL